MWGISPNQNYKVSDADAIIVLRFEKGRISQSNVGTLLVLPGTTVPLSDKKHSVRDSLTVTTLVTCLSRARYLTII